MVAALTWINPGTGHGFILELIHLAPKEHVMYQRILVPVDGSATSRRGLDEAIRLAGLSHGRLRLLHVVDELSFALGMGSYTGYAGEWMNEMRNAGTRLLDEMKATVRAAGIDVDSVLYDNFAGSVHELITTEADRWPADVIVIGTHGRRGVGRLVLGSSAENVLRFARVPVLLVRAPDEAAAAPARESISAALHLPEGTVASE
jgi:nucleotide-binding universal stress UspA family protein